MRKNFLILMLMALLPLAGWAADPAVSTAPAPRTGLTYNQSAQALITEGTAMTGNTLYYAVVATGTAAPSTSDATTTVPSETNAGSYDVYYWTQNETSDEWSDPKKITVTIAKYGTLTVVAKNPTMVYGDAAPTLADFYEIAGSWASGEGVATLGDPVEMPTIDMTNAGSKPFTLEAKEYVNYNISLTNPNGTLTIAKKALTVTADSKETITYGTGTPTWTATYGAFADDEDESVLEGTLAFEITNASDEVVTASPLPAGTYTITPKGLSADNYALTFVGASFTVNKKALAASMIADMADATYNGEAQAPTVTVSDGDLLTADDYTVSYALGGTAKTADQIIGAGTYTVKITAATGNYSGEASKTYKINQKTLYVKSKTINKTYDGTTVSPANNATYVTFVGLVGEDAADYDNITVALGDGTLSGSVKGHDADTYPINVSGSLATSLATNYTPEFGSVGSLVIAKKAITITANNDSKTYGAADSYVEGIEATNTTTDATAAKTCKLSVALGTGDAISTQPTLTRDEGETAGTYDITPSGAVIKNSDTDNTKNYDITYAKGTFTISAGGFTIWANDKSSVFGESIATLDASATGISAADAAKIVYGEGAITTTATSTSARGTYTITIDKSKIDFSAIEDDYDIDAVTVVPGNYVITPAPLKIKVKDQALYVGASCPTASADNIEFVTAGVSEEDQTAVISGITLAFSNVTGGCIVPQETGGALKAEAATTGWDGEAATTDGVWVNGIVIDAATYNASTTANYTLEATVAEGAEAAAGKLSVTATTAELTLDGYTSASTDLTTNITALTANDGKKVNVKFTNRALSKEQWGVIVLPFATTVREVSNALGYAVVDVIDATKGDAENVYFKIHMGEIAANTPFMVKTDAAVNMSSIDATAAMVTAKVIVKDVDDEGKTTAVEGAAGTKFYGLYKPVTLEHSYQWFISEGEWSKKAEGSTTTVRALRAYLQLPESADTSNARIFIEEPDGSVTVVKALDVDGLEVGNGAWYTLNGMMLNAQPTEKGVYIHNGKKVVIK